MNKATCPPCPHDWKCRQGRCVQNPDTEPGYYLGEETDRYDEEGAALLRWVAWAISLVLIAVGLPYLWSRLQ